MSTTAGESSSALNTFESGMLPAGCPTSEYGFAFIKSGFEHVESGLVEDFNDHGIDVIGVQPVVLRPAVVDYVYRDSRHEFFYPAMFRHLITRPVIAMALHSDIHENTQTVLDDLKSGRNGRPNLRMKYMPDFVPLSEEEIAAWYAGTHPSQDEVTVQLTQKNVFHAADTSEEAVESIRLLSVHNAEFWQTAPQNDPRIRRLASILTVSEAKLILK